MTRKLIEDAGLAIREKPKLELVLHIGHSRPFLGLCEDVEVAIGGLKIRHPIFVIKHGDLDLVFSQPFLNMVKFSQDYKLDRVFSTIIHFEIMELAVFCRLLSKDIANWTKITSFLSIGKILSVDSDALSESDPSIL